MFVERNRSKGNQMTKYKATIEITLDEDQSLEQIEHKLEGVVDQLGNQEGFNVRIGTFNEEQTNETK